MERGREAPLMRRRDVKRDPRTKGSRGAEVWGTVLQAEGTACAKTRRWDLGTLQDLVVSVAGAEGVRGTGRDTG